MTDNETTLIKALNTAILVGNSLAQQVRERDELIDEMNAAIDSALVIIRLQKEKISALTKGAAIESDQQNTRTKIERNAVRPAPVHSPTS